MSDLISPILTLVFGGAVLVFCIRVKMQSGKPGSTGGSMMSAMLVQQQQQTQTATASAAATPVYTPDPPTFTPDLPSYSAPACTPSDTSSCA